MWTRDGSRAYRMGRGIKAGRVWTNCYHQYPAHAAFGGYKQSGIGRENHKMMLDHYQQTKNLLVSYSPDALGLLLSGPTPVATTPPETVAPGEPSASPSRVDLTGEAADLLRRLTGIHGPLMFHQSGGCCDGSSPDVLPGGRVHHGDADVHLGDLVVEGSGRRSRSGCRCRSTSTGSTPTSPSTS